MKCVARDRAAAVPRCPSVVDSRRPIVLAPEVAPFSPPPGFPFAAEAVPSTPKGPVAPVAVVEAVVVRIRAPEADATNLLVEVPILVSGSNQPKPQPSPLGRRRPTEEAG